MKASTRIQSLQPPSSNHHVNGTINQHSFGGGGSGYIADELHQRLSSMWLFCYMGMAEFEYGVVPFALKRLVESPRTSFTLVWENKTVFVTCHEKDREEVTTRITQWSLPEGERKLKTGCGFRQALIDEPGLHHAVGWLECDNGFFFTIDPAMHGSFSVFAAEYRGDFTAPRAQDW